MRMTNSNATSTGYLLPSSYQVLGSGHMTTFSHAFCHLTPNAAEITPIFILILQLGTFGHREVLNLTGSHSGSTRTPACALNRKNTRT